MSLNKKRSTAWAVLAAWVPLGLGCIIVNPGANNAPDPPPPIESDDCSEDHDSFYFPDPAGATISGADQACNEIPYYSGGGGQGGGATVFHIEPTLETTNPDLQPTAQPYIVWSLRDIETGEIVDEQGYELFEGDIFEEPEGWSVTSQFTIGSGMRGKNYRLEAEMDVVDVDNNIVTVTPAGAVYLGYDAGRSSTF